MGAQPGTRRVSPGGGDVSARLENGTRVILRIPPGALLQSTEITVTPIDAIDGLPFAGGLAGAVRVTPDDTPLLGLAVLRFESRQPGPSGTGAAGFAIRGEREFHLYPFLRLLDPRQGPGLRVELRLARFGTYGVALATEDEVAAAVTHRPADHVARVEQRLAEAFPRVKRDARGWSLMPAVHAAQVAPGWVDRLFDAIEEGFEQLVVPRFRQVRWDDCSSREAWTAIQNYYIWMKMPDLMVPVETIGAIATDEEVRLRDQRRNGLHDLGYSDAEIDAITDAMATHRRDRIEALKARGAALVVETLRAIFSNAHKCCTTKDPMQYYVNDMLSAWREAELRSVQVDEAPMARVEECTCRVASKRLGSPDIFVGSITHQETFSSSAQKTTGATRTDSATVTLSHNERIVLERPLGPGQFLAYYNVTASFGEVNETRVQQTCGVLLSTMKFDGGPWRDSGQTQVQVSSVVNQPGTYRLSYSPLGADGYGSLETVRDFTGCQQFNPYRKDASTRARGVAAIPVNVTIEVKADPARPNELKGQKTLEAHDSFGGLITEPRRPAVSWNLQRCAVVK